MRILVLGTSNSVLQSGWVAGLKDSGVASEIVNRSIGASPGLQFACRLNDDFSSYDFVLFDSIVNEEHMPGYIGSSEYYNRVIFEICSTIASRTNLIFIGFTLADHVGKVSAAYRDRRSMAESLGCQFLSFRDLVIAYAYKIISPFETLYEHVGHPTSKIQYQIGKALGDVLADVKLPRGRSKDFRKNFSIFEVADFAKEERIYNVKNSLVDMNFAVFEQGEFVKMPSAAGLCLGFYINRRNTRCFARLKNSTGSRVKEFWHDIDGGLDIRFVPIWNGYPVSSIEILSGIQNDSSSPAGNSDQNPVFRRNFRRDAVPSFSEHASFELSAHTHIADWSHINKSLLTLSTIAYWNGSPGEDLPDARVSTDITMLERAVDKLMSARFS